MSDIMEFLRARYGEDERWAMAAVEPFMWGDRVGLDGLHPQLLPHVKRHTPARVRDDVEAKRRILAMYEHAQAQLANTVGESARAVAAAWVTALEYVLYPLASVYDTHPDYDESWRP